MVIDGIGGQQLCFSRLGCAGALENGKCFLVGSGCYDKWADVYLIYVLYIYNCYIYCASGSRGRL